MEAKSLSHFSVAVFTDPKLKQAPQSLLEPYRLNETTYEGNFDGYHIGGRWSGLLIVHPGRGVRINNASRTPKISTERHFTRDGYEYVDAALVKDVLWSRMREEHIEFARAEYSAAMKLSDEYVREKLYGIKPGTTEEEFWMDVSSFATSAVVTPDGQWHRQSTSIDSEDREWICKYHERFLATADPEWLLTIVDCHI